MTASTEPQPRIDIDWGGENVMMRISTGQVQISLSCSQECGKTLIRDLQWATEEIERFVDHCAAGRPDYSFRQTRHPEVS